MSGEAEETPPSQFWISVLWKQFRAEILARPLFYLVNSVTIVLLAGLFYWPIRVTRNAKLTDLDQILFQLFLVAFPAGISWALAKRKEEQNILTKQKALARSAVRRISSIGAAASRLSEIIELRKAAVTSAPQWAEMEQARRALLYELFDGLSKQVVEMRDNIAASEDDWRDILPEEFAKKRAAEREILQERELAIGEREKAYKELQLALEKGEAGTAEQIAALEEVMAKQIASVEQRLSLKVEQIRSQLPSSVSPLFSNPSGLGNIVIHTNPLVSPTTFLSEALKTTLASAPADPRAGTATKTLTQAAKAEAITAAKAQQEEATPNPEPQKKD